MTAQSERDGNGFDGVQFLVQERARAEEISDRVSKNNLLLERASYLMYVYGPVKYFPEDFHYASHVFDPGEYSLPEVTLRTRIGPMSVYLSAQYGDAPSADWIGEMEEATIHFKLGDFESSYTIPRTDFRDHYSDQPMPDIDDRSSQADILPPVEVLDNALYVMQLVKNAYLDSDLIPNDKKYQPSSQ